MAGALNQLLDSALAARRDKRLSDAQRDLTEAVALCRGLSNSTQLAMTLARLGQIERDLDHAWAAVQHYEAAAAIYRAEGKALGQAHTIRHVGDIHRENGRAQLAESSYAEALALYRAHEGTPPLDLANAIRGLAILKDDAGETELAKRFWEEARDLYQAVDVQAGVAECTVRLARCA